MKEIAPRIVVDRRVRVGKPVIKGTRMPVALVLELLAAGSSVDEIKSEYGIDDDDIRAVLRYAAEIVGHEEVRAS